MSLTVVTLVLNEEAFLPLYFASVIQFADEIVIVDGKSSDRSIEIIESFRAQGANIKLIVLPQSQLPYSDNWNEGERRELLLSNATSEWIIQLDADEIIDDSFKTRLSDLKQRSEVDTYAFPFIHFWENPSTIRLHDAKDPVWTGQCHLRMWRKSLNVYFCSDHGNHALPQFQGNPLYEHNFDTLDIPIFHYHYALGPRMKFNDNRKMDVNCRNNTGEPDWNFSHQHWQIRKAPFTGQHPKVIRDYLNLIIEK